MLNYYLSICIIIFVVVEGIIIKSLSVSIHIQRSASVLLFFYNACCKCSHALCEMSYFENVMLCEIWKNSAGINAGKG